jgi:hypothetical protein
MHSVNCPQCKSECEIPPDAVGPGRTDLFNVASCDGCGLSFGYDDEEVITDDRPPSQFI